MDILYFGLNQVRYSKFEYINLLLIKKKLKVYNKMDDWKKNK